jgi:hypothetical protein
VSIPRRQASIIELPVPPAAFSNYRVSHDGRRFAFLAELGSPADWARQVRAALAAMGLMPEDEPAKPAPKTAPAEALPVAGLMRAIMVG